MLFGTRLLYGSNFCVEIPMIGVVVYCIQGNGHPNIQQPLDCVRGKNEGTFSRPEPHIMNTQTTISSITSMEAAVHNSTI